MGVARYVGDEAPNGNRFRRRTANPLGFTGLQRQFAQGFFAARAIVRNQRLTIHLQNDASLGNRGHAAVSGRIGSTTC
jgi:hypothetical protein